MRGATAWMFCVFPPRFTQRKATRWPGPVCPAPAAGGTQAAEVDDRIRSATETPYQALIEAELTAVIGAGPHERTESRTAQRNGSRPRTLTTTAGDLELRIPKLRAGSFSARCWIGAGGSTRRCSRW